jgi:multisubunit Na+/H+ antiporter MnhG subunit
MSAQSVAEWVLLSCGMAVDVVCALGLFVLRSVYDRVHLLGPAAILGTGFIAAAVVVQQGHSALGIKAMLVGLILWGASPVLSHATMRAARVREAGWLPDEPRAQGDR